MDELRVSSFRGLQTLPIRVAEQREFFAAQHLVVRLAYTTGSAAQLAELAQGQVDLIQTAPDNVIHFNTQPEAFGQPRDSQAASLVMVLGGSLGPLSLYARPGLVDAQALRGAVVGVDNARSGFALVLRDLLRRAAHLEAGDYQIVTSGGTAARQESLARGAIDATVLYAPFDLLAGDKQCSRLASATAYYPAYASLATAARASWIEAHAGLLVRYLTAILRALRWIYDPSHADQVLQIIQMDLPIHCGISMARRAYAAFTDTTYGFGVEAPLTDAGLLRVMALREVETGATTSLGGPEPHRDLRWYELARANLAAG